MLYVPEADVHTRYTKQGPETSAEEPSFPQWASVEKDYLLETTPKAVGLYFCTSLHHVHGKEVERNFS